ncbi:MAG: hypothetical protein ABEJ55_05575 [Halanaeroarchaeum sp.]
MTAPDESVEGLSRLGELTVLITEGRVIKHVGSSVWDDEFEEYDFEDVTGVDIEEGDVSSQIIVEVDGRPQRIKTPSEEARQIRERIERALLSYHGVDSYRAFVNEVEEADEAERRELDAESGEGDQESIDVIEEGEAESTEQTDATASEGPEASPDEDAFEFEGVEASEETVADELAALREAVERQNELLETQQRALEALVEELQD